MIRGNATAGPPLLAASRWVPLHWHRFGSGNIITRWVAKCLWQLIALLHVQLGGNGVAGNHCSCMLLPLMPLLLLLLLLLPRIVWTDGLYVRANATTRNAEMKVGLKCFR